MYMELERLTKNKLPWTPTITENMPDIVKVVEELKKERAILTDAALIVCLVFYSEWSHFRFSIIILF